MYLPPMFCVPHHDTMEGEEGPSPCNTSVCGLALRCDRLLKAPTAESTCAPIFFSASSMRSSVGDASCCMAPASLLHSTDPACMSILGLVHACRGTAGKLAHHALQLDACMHSYQEAMQACMHTMPGLQKAAVEPRRQAQGPAGRMQPSRLPRGMPASPVAALAPTRLHLWHRTVCENRASPKGTGTECLRRS